MQPLSLAQTRLSGCTSDMDYCLTQKRMGEMDEDAHVTSFLSGRWISVMTLPFKTSVKKKNLSTRASSQLSGGNLVLIHKVNLTRFARHLQEQSNYSSQLHSSVPTHFSPQKCCETKRHFKRRDKAAGLILRPDSTMNRFTEAFFLKAKESDPLHLTVPDCRFRSTPPSPVKTNTGLE